MIRLDLKREPSWLDLGHGVRVKVRPCTTALMMAARVAALREAGDTPDAIEAAGVRTAMLVKRLALLAILDWEGVGDATGEPVELSSDGIGALIDLWPLAESFERLYLAPALLLDSEKNV